MTANAGASHSFGSQSAATPDGQGASFIDINAAALFAATEVVGALEDQGDICRISKESHGLIVVCRSIINGQIANPNRHGEVRFHLQALARGAGGNERAGDGDDLRGIKIRRGQSVAVADLDLACSVAVQDLDGALSDVKDIAVGFACRERAEGQHRQEHAQRQEDRSQPFCGVLHVCFLLLSEWDWKPRGFGASVVGSREIALPGKKWRRRSGTYLRKKALSPIAGRDAAVSAAPTATEQKGINVRSRSSIQHIF